MSKKQSQNLVELISILGHGEFHDGNSLGEKLGMTRSAVWKAIKKLENYGIGIQSDKRKGYALSEQLSLLDEKFIQDNIPVDVTATIFETITSTNDYLKLQRNAISPQVCLAEQQTSGRGRLGREWESPFAQNIYLSLLYPIAKDIGELAGLSLAVSLAVRKALEVSGIKHDLFVKWPNDVIHASKKLAGTLIEVQAESNGLCQVVIGVGLNVNMTSAKIAQAWTSMHKITNQFTDRNPVAVTLINQLLAYVEKFIEKGFTAFVDEWVANDCLYNKIISLQNLDTTVTGKVVGIDSHGHLLLELPGKEVRAFSSGDTTVLK